MKRFTLAAVEPPRGSMVVCRWQRGNYFSSSRRANERRFNLPIIFAAVFFFFHFFLFFIFFLSFFLPFISSFFARFFVKTIVTIARIYFCSWFDSSARTGIIGSGSAARWYGVMKMSLDSTLCKAIRLERVCLLGWNEIYREKILFRNLLVPSNPFLVLFKLICSIVKFFTMMSQIIF